MKRKKEYFDEKYSMEEREMFKEKFCKGTMKARTLTQEEIQQLKKEGRI